MPNRHTLGHRCGIMRRAGPGRTLRHSPTLASVCPLRANTPPSFARNGTKCPGLVKSLGPFASSASERAVSALSCAEMPVVTPAERRRSRRTGGGCAVS